MTRMFSHRVAGLLIAFVGPVLFAAGVTPAGPPAGASPVRWPAPPLESPITIELGTGQTSTLLDQKKDYIIKLPKEKKVGVTELTGGRNVVIIGGHVTVPGSKAKSSPPVKHFSAFHLRHQTGTVHIEGVLIDNSAGGEGWDAFFTACPRAIVQIQNVRVEGLSGKFEGHHADIIQIGHGVKELRVDRLTGTTDYQGLFLKVEEHLRGQGKFGNMYFSNVNLAAFKGSFNQALLYLTTPDYYMEGEVNLYEVYLQPIPTYTVNYIVPRATTGTYSQLKTGAINQFHAWKDGNKVSWPFFKKVRGSIYEGAPEKDFVPSGSVGIGYVPPQ